MTRVLVPVAVLEGEAVSAGLIAFLATMDVTVLGYHVVPDQTPPDQARLQFQERATATLEDIVGEFHAAGARADHRLVFTRDRDQTIERVAAESNAGAIAITGATGTVDQLLVPLTGDVDRDRLLGFVEELVDGRDVGVTVFLAGEETEDARHVLDAATRRLLAAGIEARSELVAGNAFDALISAVPGHDTIVMGERAPSLRALVFGEEPDRVAAASVGPVVVVRAADPPDA